MLFSSKGEPSRLLLEMVFIVIVSELLIQFGLPLVALNLHGAGLVMVNVLALVFLASPSMYWRSMEAVRRNRRMKPDRFTAEKIGSAAGYSLRSAVLMTALTQLLGVGITALLLMWNQIEFKATSEQRFKTNAGRTALELQKRFDMALFGLRDLKGAVLAVGSSYNREAHRKYVEVHDMYGEFPGVRAFGYIQHVQRSSLASFVQSERADQASFFEVRTSGSYPDLYVIKYMEPATANRPVIGLDLAQDNVRREVMERAMQTRSAALSARITLYQINTSAAGFLLVLPLTNDGINNKDGFVFAPLSVPDLMRGLSEISQGTLDIVLQETENPGSIMYASDQRGHSGLDLHSFHEIKSGGRSLYLSLSPNSKFDALVENQSPILIALGGLFSSTFAAWTVWLLSSGRINAQRNIERVTREFERMARVAQGTTNAVILTDADNRISWINPGFTRITGYSVADALGKTPGELLTSPNADPKALEILRHGIEKGESCRVEILNRKKDGSEYWVETEVLPTRDASGKVIGFMEIANDITEHKLDQQQLHEVSDRLSLAIEGGSDGLWDWMDVNRQEEWWSPSYYTLLGYTPEELPATINNFRTILHPHDVAHVHRALEDAQQGRRDYDVTYRSRTKDKGYRWFRSRAKVYRDENGLPLRMAGTVQDIHDRRTAEAEVRRSGAILRSSIDAMDDGYALFDPEDKLLLCNQRFREFFSESAVVLESGNSFEEILRFGVSQGQIPPEAIGREEAWISERLASHRMAYSRFQRRLKSGRIVRVVERRTEDGYIVSLLTDVTDFVQTTRTAEEASRSKSQFLANMSHEIRTPMNAILGMLKLLQSTDLTERQSDYAAKTEGAARSLLGLLNDILDFSKVEAGKLVLDPHPVRVEKLLLDLSVILSANQGEKDIEVMYDIDPRIPASLIADDLRLQQVLINLTSNAIKFTPSGEVVLCMTMLEKGERDVLIEFSVRDSGIGILPENQQHIFSGFSQAEASTTRRFGGTGLGLAISARLVGAMGGQLRLDSAPGKGSNFFFVLRLPLSEMSSAPLVGAPLPEGMHLLLVEENDVARNLISEMAVSEGWKVDTAANGVQAVEMVKRAIKAESDFQAILVDWKMAHMDGWRTVRRLRADLAHRTVRPLILMCTTAYGRSLAAQRSPKDQILLDGYLVKPFTSDMMRDAFRFARSASELAELGANPSLVSRHEKPQRLKGMRILLVEDNKVNQMVARGLLEQEGALLAVADDGRLGVQAVATMQPEFDAVLMDIQMPQMDGYAATRAIREELGHTKLPIIAMTANAMASDRDACLAAGMNDHIGKPFDLDQLIFSLLKCTNRKTDSVNLSMPVRVQSRPRQMTHPPGTLDMQSALGRVGGDEVMLASIVQKFLDGLKDMGNEIESALQFKDSTAATRQLHTLKGLAATVGALHLSEVASQLEEKARSQNLVELRTTGLVTLRHAIETATEALKPFVQSHSGQTVPTETAEPHTLTEEQMDELVALVRELHKLLRAQDMQALNVHAMLRERYGSSMRALLTSLEEAVAGFQFDSAAQQCEVLLDQLGA